MRVISGKLKGRNIDGYNIVGTRPTMDRVKESIFGMIQNYINDSVVLDLFSGTGNYGIECISNGSNLVYFNDYNPKCIDIINYNLSKMNVLDYGKLTTLDYRDALKYYKKNNIKFDLIFLDPPYKEHIINEVLDFLIQNELLNDKGLVICEFMKKEDYLDNKLKLIKEKKYGEKYVFIYKYGN